MPSLRIGHAEREQALERLKTAYAEGRLDEPEFEDRAGRAMRARSQDELSPLLDDLPAGPTEPSGVGPASLRDRVGDRLVRALRCAVFCWLPPPRARD
ncbi:DUF1707 domain-containing protein [Streptomyces sp. ISL-100]|uniref:DUF1707 SHOCT-like domain-containing protein n=1 Tax=Streptomyces sp. ISL-100 TaxID=2819173 RepID=UPI001BEB2B6B|nr:DUF1707 domain-containing protein [Streptomyces sp. ISL-100]MBT2401518.1 DUF1707 domain-containing protein [Streptomyces sp. ISL-100]